MKTDLFIEFNGRQTDIRMLLDMATETWKADGHKVKDLAKVELHYNPEQNKCYYKFNDNLTGVLSV